MDKVSNLSSGIPLESRSDIQVRQSWDYDLAFWEDPATLHAIEELILADIEEAALVAQREQATGGGPPPMNHPRDHPRDNGKGSGGKVASSSARAIPATPPRPSQPPQSQSKNASCRVIT